MITKNKLINVPQFLWIVLLLGAFLYLGKNLTVVSDMSQFMPASGAGDNNASINLFLDEIQQGVTSKILFISVRADTTENTARFSKRLKRDMLQSGLFVTVANGEIDYEWQRFEKLFRYRYLLKPHLSSTDFSAEKLRLALTQRLADVRAGLGMVLKQTLAADPQNIFFDYLRGLARQQMPAKQYGVWFSADRQEALLLATMNVKGFDLDAQQRAITFVKRDLAEKPEVNIVISGPGSYAVASREKIQQASRILSVAATILILLLFWFAYRSIRLIVLVGLPLISAISFAMLVTNAVFGQVHGITLVFGITLLGVCIDYPVHFFSHLQQQQTALQVIRKIWPTLQLSVVTTSLGYLAFWGTDFTGLSQLAVFTVTGLLSAVAVTRWVLPAWIGTGYVAVIPGWLPLLPQKPGGNTPYYPLLPVLLSMLALSAFFWRDAVWEQDVSALSPIPAEARQTDRRLRQALGAPDVNHLFVLADRDAEKLLQRIESIKQKLQILQAEGLIGRIYAATDILPSRAMQERRKRQLPPPAVLQKNLATALQGLPFRPAFFQPFLQDVAASRSLEPLSVEFMMQTPLAEQLRSNFFWRKGKWISIVRLAGVSDAGALERWLESHPAVGKYYLNLHKATGSIVDNYRREALQRIVWGALIISLFLLITIGSLKKGAGILLPVVLAVILSLGVQLFAGTKLNLFHLLSLLLVAGIGLDYSLFFARHTQGARERLQSLHGVMIGAASTIIAFGLLALSGIPVLVAIGQTVALGVLACFILTLLMSQ